MILWLLVTVRFWKQTFFQIYKGKILRGPITNNVKTMVYDYINKTALFIIDEEIFAFKLILLGLLSCVNTKMCI